MIDTKAPQTPTEALLLAIDRARGQTALARKIGTIQQNVFYWVKKRQIGPPAEFVLAIERETGVSRHCLRPDLYPAPPSPQANAA
ncbi:YdaS family helix-turn-helix protein [Methylopila sp. 73B]|uniref:YdaS family helix-turn-helix protein n=1 Tax=Methylopila sp. 73B TaxID=1120792 RepID=UPI000463095E|nr:YdaS family helix-turn-helix protein [Methylopila sp. 73B]